MTIFRGMVDKLVVRHEPKPSIKVSVDIYGELGNILEYINNPERCMLKMVAGAGFEPAAFRL